MSTKSNKSLKTEKILIPFERIENKILFLRGHKVMLDKDLAELYGVQTKVLNQAVKRNLTRFPADFMFQMTKEELENWRSQFVTSNREKMGLRRKPYLFTEQGVAMLSSVLNSERAIQVNIQIMRTFTKLRELMTTHKDLAQKLDLLERRYNQHDKDILVIFETLRRLMNPPKKPIGFHP